MKAGLLSSLSSTPSEEAVCSIPCQDKQVSQACLIVKPSKHVTAETRSLVALFPVV